MNIMAIFARMAAWINATYVMMTAEDLTFMAMNTLS